jgi:hypothetical protein
MNPDGIIPHDYFPFFPFLFSFRTRFRLGRIFRTEPQKRQKRKKTEFRQQHWNELEEILLPSRTGYTVRTDNHWVPDGKIQPSSLIVRGASG